MQGLVLLGSRRFGFFALFNVSKLPVNEVPFNDMLRDTKHKLGISRVPLVKDAGNLDDILPMQFDCNVSSMVSLVVTFLVASTV